MLSFSTTTALSMMDRMLGGEGAVDDSLEDDYSYTDLELKLYEDLAEDTVKVMDRSWENYVPIRFTYSRTEVNPTLNQVIGLDETVVIVDLKLMFPNMSGRMSVCLPGEVLANVFAEISRESPMRRSAAEDKSDEIFDKLRDSKLEIIAELASAQLSPQRHLPPERGRCHRPGTVQGSSHLPGNRRLSLVHRKDGNP